MTDPNPNQGCGRGGRGALLLAAFQNKSRRPAEQPSEESRPPFARGGLGAGGDGLPTVGRGAMGVSGDGLPTVGRGALGVSAVAAPTLGRGAFPGVLPAGGRGAMALPGVSRDAAVPTVGRGAMPVISGDPAQSIGRGVMQGAVPGVLPMVGRGAMLSQLLQAQKDQQQTHAPAATGGTGEKLVPAPIVGRGGVISSGRGVMLSHLKGATSAPVPTETRPPRAPSPPVQQMSLMAVTQKPYQRGSKDGREVNLAVNYIRLSTQENKGRYEYHVHFDPIVDSLKIRYELLREPDVVNVIGPIKQFDGAKLYLPFKLQDEVTQLHAKMRTDGTSITLNIKFIRHCQGRDCIQFYNILFRRIMRVLKLCQFGRNYFDPRGGISVPQHKLEIWPGYVTAIQEYDGGVMLNCDSSFRVLRSETAMDVLLQLSRRGEDFQKLALQTLVNCVCLTRYNNQTYRIDDVDFSQNPRSTFSLRSGEEISYMDYYKNHYDITIRDTDQPLLIHRDKPKGKQAEEEGTRLIVLVPELVYMTGLTDDMRANFKVMKDVATHTRVTPAVRQLALEKFADNVKTNPEARKMLDDWGLQLEGYTVSLKGWVLNPEEIVLKNKAFFANKEADWGREVCQDSVICAVDLSNWLLIFTKRDASKASEFLVMMKRVCPQLGIKVRDPHSMELSNDRTDSFLRAVKDNVNPQVQMVVFIFPTMRDDRYSAVKKLCCVEMPVPSQVINARTIGQPQKLRSVTQKIALQINCKMGGELWALRIPIKSAFMVVGVDVYHDPTRGKRSVLGFVSSLNSTLTRWYSVCPFQEPGQELGDCLKTALIAALRKFHEVNHDLPKMIFFYRDGVGDGQLRYVQDYEVAQLTSCFECFGPDFKPTLTVVVVQKKINTRIYLRSGANGQINLENPPPGTVLDHTVTRKNMYDFFLVSQHVRQGTVSPTHYIVLSDTSNMTPDKVQKLSYKLTHLYYNWPGTVRVPAPCQYAHKLAYLCGQNIHKPPHPSLADKLFFL